MVTFTKDDIITTDKYLGLSSNKIVYLKTDLIHNGWETMKWRGKIHNIQKGDVWITGHSNYCIDSKLLINIAVTVLIGLQLIKISSMIICLQFPWE